MKRAGKILSTLRTYLAALRTRREQERQAEALQRVYAGHRRAAVEMGAGR